MFYKKYYEIVSIENILETWQRFLPGKRYKKDVMEFQAHLGKNLASLYYDLQNKTYNHGPYSAFNISDPKPRNIHKATVRDRILHHIIYRALYPYFESRFIYDSYSCRKHKGTHKAINRFRAFAAKVSRNYMRTCFVLKCDIKKFFATIDQELLMKVLKRHIKDAEIITLIHKIVSSFHGDVVGRGLPLGNLTSQLLVNVYMHEFDMYMKRELRVKYYIRYADDFVILSESKEYLKNILKYVEIFLEEKLHLALHPSKVFIKTYASGVDFLGWVHFSYYRQIRTSTKKRIIRNTKYFLRPQTINSYRGLLSHGNSYRVKKIAGIL